jgi:CBS domain-containing protein
MLIEEIIRFLKRIPPFHLLDENELKWLAERVSLEYYPRGYKILTQDGPPSNALRVIKRGIVKVYMTSDNSGDIVIDLRGEGELFGIISTITGDRSRATIRAEEDVICYAIEKPILKELLERNPALNEYFMKSYFVNFIDKTYDETRKRFSLLCQADRSLFTTPVGELVRREPVTIDEESSIKEAAQIMTRENIGSLIITRKGVPVGIITDRDLRRKVVAKNKDVAEPVKHIMSPSLIRMDSNEHCFEALLKMIRFNIHHLIVIEGGEFKGVVSNHDFLLLQGYSPLVLIKEIEEAFNIEKLSMIREKIHLIVSSLIREGARAHNIAGIITELVEKTLIKIAELIEKRLGPSPLPYSLFIYGDGGRRELTLNPHIKLGIAIEDTNNPQLIHSTQLYFEEYLMLLNDSIQKIGYPENLPAMMSEDIKMFSDWHNLFKDWAEDPFIHSPDVDYIDMRCIKGDEDLVNRLRNNLITTVKTHYNFMDYIATVTVENRPPLGFLKRFVVDKSGEHKDELNLYQKGLIPIAYSSMVFAIEKNIFDRPTIKRLRKLGEKYDFTTALDLIKAYEYLYTLLIHEQVVKGEQSILVDDFINPERLGNLEKKTLKESFQLIANVYDTIEKSYRTERTP